MVIPQKLKVWFNIGVVVTPIGCSHIVTVHVAICPINYDEPAVFIFIINTPIYDCTYTMDKNKGNKSHMMIIIVQTMHAVSHFYSAVILVSEL